MGDKIIKLLPYYNIQYSAVFRILWKGGQICVSGNEGGAKPPSLCVSTCKGRGFGIKFYIYVVEAQSSLYS